MRSLITLALLVVPFVGHAESTIKGTITTATGEFRSGTTADFTPTSCSITSRTFQNQLSYYASVDAGDLTASNAFVFYSGNYAGLPDAAPTESVSLRSPDHATALRFSEGTLTLKTSATSRSVGTGITSSLGGWIGGEHRIVLTTDKTTVFVQGTKAHFILHRYYTLVPVKIAEADCTLERPLF